MKLPIPDDWDGQDWACIQVQWPNSPLWIAMLNGWLSQSARGRTWDERDGSILDVQAVGREIWNRNRLLTSCEGENITPPPEIITKYVYLMQDDDESEEENMGCNCCLEWQNGILMQLVCGEWQAVPGQPPGGAPTSSGDDPSDPETPQPGDDPGVNLNVKCRCGYVIARAMWRVHERIMDYIDDVIAIPFIGEKVSNDLPEYTLGKYHISVAAGNLIAASATADLDIVFATEETYVHDLASYMEKFLPEKYTLNTIQYNGLATLLLAYSFHEGIEVNLGQFVEGDYWRQIFWALGLGTVNEIMASARLLSEDEYACEERSVVVPAIDDVYWSGALNNAWKPPEVNNATLTLSANKDKATFHQSGVTGLAFTDQQFTAGMVSINPLTSLTLRFEGNTPTNDWHTPSVPDLTDLQKGVLLGVTSLVSVVAGGSVEAGYIDIEYTFDAAHPLGFGWPDISNSARHNPGTTLDGWSSNFSVSIRSWVEA